MMYFLWSTPPQTLVAVTPASLATSTNVTDEPFWAPGREAALSRRGLVHARKGVASASMSFPPRRREEAPRNLRRVDFILSSVCRVSAGLRWIVLAHRRQCDGPPPRRQTSLYYGPGARLSRPQAQLAVAGVTRTCWGSQVCDQQGNPYVEARDNAAHVV